MCGSSGAVVGGGEQYEWKRAVMGPRSMSDQSIRRAPMVRSLRLLLMAEVACRWDRKW